MRKIRDFKLRLPYKEIRRKIRKELDLDAMGLGDPRFQIFIDSVQERLHPSGIFESFGPGADTAGLSPLPGLAHTLGLATLGAGSTDLSLEARAAGPERGRLMELVSAAAMERTVQFVLGLLEEEVEAERCELSPIHYLQDPEQVLTVVEKLEGSKIGLRCEAGRLLPDSSAAFCLSWLMRRGAKKK